MRLTRGVRDEVALPEVLRTPWYYWGVSSAETKGERRDSRRTSGYLPTLDGWRTIAVCMVMLCHMPHAGIRRGYLLTEVGAFGVDVFFAISGFLICTRLLEEERAHGRFSMGGFYLRRAFRILPASVFYLAVVGVLSLLRFFPLNWAGWWGALAFFRNYQVFPESAGFSDWPTAHFGRLGLKSISIFCYRACCFSSASGAKPCLVWRWR